MTNKQTPDGFIVLDEHGDFVYASGRFEQCNDFINDAYEGDDFEEVKSWVIREFIFIT